MSVFRRSQTAPLQLVINRRGGVTGATVLVAVRRKETPDSYLDFSDDTFKTVGWTTRQAAVTEVGDGRYVYFLDLSAITNLPVTTERLAGEFEVTAPASDLGVADAEIELHPVVDGFDRDQHMALQSAAVAGLTSGGPGASTFKALDKVTDRISGTTADAVGDRTAATYDVTGV